MGRYAEIRAVEDEVADLEERLASRKAVDQAKGLLQEGLGLSEAEAFRWIQKTAMDLRISMREVADQSLPRTGRPEEVVPGAVRPSRRCARGRSADRLRFGCLPRHHLDEVAATVRPSWSAVAVPVASASTTPR